MERAELIDHIKSGLEELRNDELAAIEAVLRMTDEQIKETIMQMTKESAINDSI